MCVCVCVCVFTPRSFIGLLREKGGKVVQFAPRVKCTCEVVFFSTHEEVLSGRTTRHEVMYYEVIHSHEVMYYEVIHSGAAQ